MMRQLGRHMRAIILATIIAILGWTTNGQAENASREKCTCDPKPGELQDNGASVENATACWASVDEGREWCRITVEALEGGERHKDILDELKRTKGDPGSVVGYLQSLSDGALTVEGDQSSPEFANAMSELPAVMKSYDAQAAKCIESFLAKAAGFEDRNFGCHISDLTGWLRMSYGIGAIRFVFMIAPDV